MQGSQVFGQLPIGEVCEVLALLPQKGLQAIERRLVSPAGVLADAGPGQFQRRQGVRRATAPDRTGCFSTAVDRSIADSFPSLLFTFH